MRLRGPIEFREIGNEEFGFVQSVFQRQLHRTIGQAMSTVEFRRRTN